METLGSQALLCGAPAVALIVLLRLRYVYGLVALVGIASLIALFLKEHLSGTGRIGVARRGSALIVRGSSRLFATARWPTQ